MKIQDIISPQPLMEAKGLFGRKAGDIFTDDNGEKARFEEIKMYPPEGETYPDIKSCDAAKNEIEKKSGIKILWANAHRPNLLAFAIARLTMEDGNTMLWGRHYQSVPKNPIGTWGNQDAPGTWSLQTKSAKKMKTGLTPQDLIATEQSFSNPAAVISWIENKGAPAEIVDGLNQLASGKLPVFQGQSHNLEAIRDYLGEIMQPIALMTGMVGADADLARKEVLKKPWKQCSVMWPQAKNTNLVDSVFSSKTGATLGISSKGASGANASSANIWTAITKAQENNRTDLLTEHAKMIEIMKIINENSAIEGPIVLGLRFNIITDKVANEIRKLVQDEVSDTTKLSPQAKKLFSEYGGRSNVSGYRVGYVLLATLAKKVSEYVNHIPEFGQGCLEFLNQASILQIYTSAKVVGTDVHITGFNAIYPPEYSGTVYLDAGKNYFSSRIAGKISFKYVPQKS